MEPGTQPGTVVTLRGRGHAADRPQAAPATSAWSSTWSIPRNLTARQRELLEELRDSVTEDNLREAAGESLLSKVRRALR